MVICALEVLSPICTLFGPDAQLKLIVQWQVTLAEDLALSLVLFHIFPLCLVASSYFVCGVFLWGFCALICLYLGNFVQGGGSLAEFHRKPWVGVKFHNGILNDSSPNCSAVFWLLYLAIIVLLCLGLQIFRDPLELWWATCGLQAAAYHSSHWLGTVNRGHWELQAAMQM